MSREWNLVYDIHTHTHACTHVHTCNTTSIYDIQPIAFGVSCNLILHSQSNWSLFNGTGQERCRAVHARLIFEIREMRFQIENIIGCNMKSSGVRESVIAPSLQ